MHFTNWRRALVVTVVAGCGMLPTSGLMAQKPLSTQLADYESSLYQTPSHLVRQVGCFDGECAEPDCGCEEVVGCDTVGGGCDGASAKKKQDELKAAVAGAYKGLFFLNDFSYINDPCYKDHHLGDCFKQLAGPCCSTIDFGGEIRTRYHSEENFSTPGLGLTGNGNPLTGGPSEFWLNRLRLYSDWKINKYLRVYGEMIHADMGGFAAHRPRPIEVNRHDIQNAFFDLKFLDMDGISMAVRPGRQELLYGAQRLISPLDWANTRRTFEGVKLMGQTKNWKVDGFFVNPMTRPVGANFHHNAIDAPNYEVDFYGVYGQAKGLGAGQALDLYYLGLDNTAGANDFSYHTVGVRNAGTLGKSGIKYEVELGGQFGENTSGSGHSAAMAVVGAGRQFTVANYKPIVWLWYDYASGGGVAGDGWHHMFPLAHKYNGFMDLFGRRNLHDLNAQFILPINKRVKLLAWYHYFLMDKATTPSSIVMTNFVAAHAAGNPGNERELGHEIDLAATISLNPRAQVFMGYSYFDSGAYYTNPANAAVPFTGDAQFLYCQMHYRF